MYIVKPFQSIWNSQWKFIIADLGGHRKYSRIIELINSHWAYQHYQFSRDTDGWGSRKNLFMTDFFTLQRNNLLSLIYHGEIISYGDDTIIFHEDINVQNLETTITAMLYKLKFLRIYYERNKWIIKGMKKLYIMLSFIV